MKFIKKISKETGNTESNNITKILKGSVISIILTIIGLWVYSVILANTEIGESTVNYVVIGITSISILIGSILSISKIEKKGMIGIHTTWQIPTHAGIISYVWCGCRTTASTSAFQAEDVGSTPISRSLKQSAGT